MRQDRVEPHAGPLLGFAVGQFYLFEGLGINKPECDLSRRGNISVRILLPFDAANRQTLRYANRGGGIFAKEEHAISHSRIH
jgi:hypothetical protein